MQYVYEVRYILNINFSDDYSVIDVLLDILNYAGVSVSKAIEILHSFKLLSHRRMKGIIVFLPSISL